MKKNSIDIAKQLNFLMSTIKDSYKQLTIDISMYDLQEQDILHYIEGRKLSASQMSTISKLIRDIRVKRRLAKNELRNFQSIMDKVSGKINLLENALEIKDIESTYTIKTNILKDNGFSDCLIGNQMTVDNCITKTVVSSPLVNDYDKNSEHKGVDLTNVSNPTILTDEHIIKSKRELDSLVSLHNIESGNDLDFLEDIIDSEFGTGKGKRRIVVTNISTTTNNNSDGESNSSVSEEFSSFEKAIMSVLGSKIELIKPTEIIKNVVGIMKAIKSGNTYLGYKWEIK